MLSIAMEMDSDWYVFYKVWLDKPLIRRDNSCVINRINLNTEENEKKKQETSSISNCSGEKLTTALLHYTKVRWIYIIHIWRYMKNAYTRTIHDQRTWRKWYNGVSKRVSNRCLFAKVLSEWKTTNNKIVAAEYWTLNTEDIHSIFVRCSIVVVS